MNRLEKLQKSLFNITIKNIYYAAPLSGSNKRSDTAKCIRVAVPLTGCHRIKISTKNGTELIKPVPGEAVFMPHGCWNCPDWEMEAYTVTFIFINNLLYANLVKSINKKPVILKKFHSSLKYSPETSQVLELLDNILRSSKVDSRAPYLTQVLIISAIEDLKKGVSSYQKKSDTTWLAIDHFIREHFTTNLARNDIAETFRLTPNYISTLCHEKTGTTFNQYLTHLRLQHAAYLLKASKYTIGEIACMCGYSETSYFCKIFRKYFASSPRSYRLTHA